MRLEDVPPEVAEHFTPTPRPPTEEGPVDMDWNDIVQFDSREDYDKFLAQRKEAQ